MTGGKRGRWLKNKFFLCVISFLKKRETVLQLIAVWLLLLSPSHSSSFSVSSYKKAIISGRRKKARQAEADTPVMELLQQEKKKGLSDIPFVFVGTRVSLSVESLSSILERESRWSLSSLGISLREMSHS